MSVVKHVSTKLAEKAIDNHERSARANLMDELFQDFNRNRVQVYKMNFVRGIFFGLGSVLGGTIVVALLIGLLSAFVDIFPPLANFLNTLIETMQKKS